MDGDESDYYNDITMSRPFTTSLSRLAQRGDIERYGEIRSLFTQRYLRDQAHRPVTQIHQHIQQSRSYSSSQPPPPPSQFSSNPPPPASQRSPNPHPQPHINYPPFILRLLQRIPHSSSSVDPHRRPIPSKEDLLRASTSFWQRVRIRARWWSIRGWRRFNTDDWSAVLSWFVVGNTIWIIIGTTTFFSAIFATLNSLSLQSYVANFVSDYLTKNTGFMVVFESAIVPRWGASSITFRNVYVSRRPQEEEDEPPPSPKNRLKIFSPSSPPSSVPSHADPTTTTTAHRPTPSRPRPKLETDPIKLSEAEDKRRQDNNYTMFDVNFDEVEVELSLLRWLDGKGLVRCARVRGVRGVIDRRHVFWDLTKPLDPADFRHETKVGDFELERFEVEDFLVTVYQPGGQRPFNVSLFNATLGQFRKRWMLYDMMSAEGMTGQFDNCLFSLHKPQKLGRSGAVVDGGDDWVKRLARFRIDGLPIEHAQYATGSTGPISWITSGKLDAVVDIKFPRHPDEEVDIREVLEQIGRNVAEIVNEVGGSDTEEQAEEKRWTARAAAETAEQAVLAQQEVKMKAEKRGEVNPGQHRLAKPALRAPDGQEEGVGERPRHVKVDIDLRFRDLKAAVPIYTTDLSVRNNALIRPIVAFINANRTLVPIHCSLTAPLSDFDGSWTLFETGLTRSISDQVYSALAHHVSSYTANTQRIRTVGVWGIQRGAEAVLQTLRTVVDPVHAQAQTMMSG